jgi:fatty acid amide hydrolase 2
MPKEHQQQDGDAGGDTRVVYSDRRLEIRQQDRPRPNVWADLCLLLAVLPFVVPVVVCQLLWRVISYRIGKWYRRITGLRSPVCTASHPSLSQAARDIAYKIQVGEYTSCEVVRASITHTKAVNKYVNAVCNTRYEEALEEARQCDEEIKKLKSISDIAAGKKALDKLFQERPYYGVPCSIKECFGLAGTPSQSSGFVKKRGQKPFIDATAVNRLRGAGFIPICNTNLSEGCMWYESSNTLFGRTNNAYDQGRIVGGSSGGEACLISTAAVPCGLGSDIGGSIRMPAAMNGIFGHKPTGGLVPATGQYPTTPYPFLTTGPLCLKSADLLPMLRILAGSDGVDPACKFRFTDLTSAALPKVCGPINVNLDNIVLHATPEPTKKRCETITSWNDVSVFCIPWPALKRNSPPTSTPVACYMQEAVNRVVSTLTSDSIGCRGPFVFPFPEFAQAFDLWGAVLASAEDNPKFAQVMADGHRHSEDGKLWFAMEALKWCVGCSDCTLPAIILSLIEDLPIGFQPEKNVRLLKTLGDLKQRVNNLLVENNGVLVFPGFPTVAPIHDTPVLRVLDCSYTAIFNVLELPITVAPILPTGFTTQSRIEADGIPVAVQLVAGRLMDRLTVAVAEALEAVGVAGWTAPPLVNVGRK